MSKGSKNCFGETVVTSIIGEVRNIEIGDHSFSDQIKSQIDEIVRKHSQGISTIENIATLLDSHPSKFTEIVNQLAEKSAIANVRFANVIKARMVGYSDLIIKEYYPGLTPYARQIIGLHTNRFITHGDKVIIINIYDEPVATHTFSLPQINATCENGILFVTETDIHGDGKFHVINMYSGKSIITLTLHDAMVFHNDTYIALYSNDHINIYQIDPVSKGKRIYRVRIYKSSPVKYIRFDDNVCIATLEDKTELFWNFHLMHKL